MVLGFTAELSFIFLFMGWPWLAMNNLGHLLPALVPAFFLLLEAWKIENVE